MLVLKEKKDCTGCGACAAKCPKNAIVMKPDEEGFLYPDIQESICIRCNLCMKVCPQNGNNYVINGVIGFWGGKIKDESILKINLMLYLNDLLCIQSPRRLCAVIILDAS